jgi:peptidoglycan/LPS O-acetylase OafA/YrhL
MNRLPGLDLLRAIAIVWVMLFHSWIVGGFNGALQSVSSYGWMGVDLFFVLSGYLIGYQLLKPLSQGQPLLLGEFYKRRACRILPAYLVVLAVYALWPSLREASGMQPLWQFLTFTLNLLIDYQHNQAFSHAWSLCVEEQFYLFFPLLAWLLTRLSSRNISLCVFVFAIAIGMFTRGYASLHGMDYLERIYYPTYTRLDGLLAGIVLAAIQAYRPDGWAALQRRPNAMAILGALTVCVAIWLCSDREALAAVLFAFPLLALGFALLVAAATSPHGFGRWHIPGAHWMASASYSLYLSHKLAMHAVATALASRPSIHGVEAFGIYAVTILAVGALLHYAIERPFLRLRNRGSRAPARARDQPDAVAG